MWCIHNVIFRKLKSWKKGDVMKKLEEDKIRYNTLSEMPIFQKFMRKGQETQNPFCKILYKALFAYYRNKNLIEMPLDINIGGGDYI